MTPRLLLLHVRKHRLFEEISGAMEKDEIGLGD